MANPYGKLKAVNADNSRSRCKVVAYAADPVLQDRLVGNDSNLLIVFYVQIMPDDLVMQLHRF